MAFRGERFFILHNTISTREPTALVEYSPVPRYRTLFYLHFIQLCLAQHHLSILLSMMAMTVNQLPHHRIRYSLLFPRLPEHPHPDIAAICLLLPKQARAGQKPALQELLDSLTVLSEFFIYKHRCFLFCNCPWKIYAQLFHKFFLLICCWLTIFIFSLFSDFFCASVFR